jgi:hypothetical protein
VPDYYWQWTGRADLDGGNQCRIDMLTEAISSIVRQSLLKILKDDLLRYFRLDGSSEDYFRSLHLTKTDNQKSSNKHFV